MRHIIETGSDIAAWCAFDPGAVVAELPQSTGSVEWAKLKELHAKNQLWLHSTSADGTYLVHVLVGETLPATFTPHATTLGEPTKLQVPTGSLRVSGAEVLTSLPIRPNPTETVSIPAGTYALSAWELEWPETAVAAKLDEGFTPAETAARTRTGLYGVAYVAATMLCSVGALFATSSWLIRGKTSGTTVAVWWAAAGLLVAVIPRFLSFGSDKDSAREAEIRAQFPNFVLSLQPA